MITITGDFVDYWAKQYDRNPNDKDHVLEQQLHEWIEGLSEPKYLDRAHFITLALWKSPRARPYYEQNNEDKVVERTRKAYQESDPEVKVLLLQSLRGVKVPVASTILFFLHPTNFPIFDFHARKTLEEAGLWKRSGKDAGLNAYLEYIDTVRQISQSLGIELRKVEKAIHTYDKLMTKESK